MGRESKLRSDESLADGLERIEEGLRAKPEADTLPEILKVRQVKTIVSVFQPRSLEGRLIEDEGHIEALIHAIGTTGNPKVLDPIIVWWAGSIGWVCIDGHHRLEAYHRLKHGGLALPVHVFRGTLDEARAEAIAANSKNKLPMRSDDKFNMAWRLVLTSSLSKARISDACKIGERTVAHMRAKAKAVQEKALELDEEFDPYDLASKSWKLANRLSPEELLGVGRPPTSDDEIRDKLRETAERMARALAKSLGKTIVVNPESFAMAIEIIEERLPCSLMSTEAWQDHLDSVTDELIEEHDFL